MKKNMFKLTMVVISFLFTQSVFAHHLWIEKEGGLYKVLWGHPPETSPYEPEKLKEARAFDSDGKEAPLTRKNEKGAVYLASKSDVSMISVSFEGGYLVTTPDGKKRVTKREAEKTGLQIIDSVYSTQYAKGLFVCSENTTKASGLKFEIVPLKNPCKMKPNEGVPLRIYFEGKPLEGATVETGNHAEAGRTDKDGNFSIKVSAKGMQIILAKYRIPAKDNPDADYLSYTTVLTFEVK
jgi:nickel transport protein